MFRTKLSIAFAVLAIAAVLQGVMAWFAVSAANTNVQKGRVANELLVGYVDLLSNKQLLRNTLTNELSGFNPDPKERQVYYYNMLRTLDELDRLALSAFDLNGKDPTMVPELQARRRSLEILRKGIEQVGIVVASASWKYSSNDLLEIRDNINRVFDVSDGQDLRAALTQSIGRERLATARDRAAADASLALISKLVIAATITLTILVVLLALYFIKALSSPLRRLIRGAEALQAGDLSHRIPETSRDEFSQLARSMNGMAREISSLRDNDIRVREQLEREVRERTSDLQEALHRLEKIELRRKQLFADISHELKTPTTAIRGEAEITLRGRSRHESEYRAALERIVEYTQHLGYVVDDMLTLARSDIDALVLDRKPLNVSALCADFADTATALVQARGLALKTDLRSASQVLGDAQRLKQVLNILVDNAIQYSGQGAVIEIGTESVIDDEGLRRCKIRVGDSGRGIPEAEVHRVFGRHFRGHRAKELRPDGSGLGLPLAAAIVRAHHGTIELNSVEGQGTQVIIDLPGFDATTRE